MFENSASFAANAAVGGGGFTAGVTSGVTGGGDGGSCTEFSMGGIGFMILSLGITIALVGALFYYVRQRFEVLEVSHKEQIGVMQSFIGSIGEQFQRMHAYVQSNIFSKSPTGSQDEHQPAHVVQMHHHHEPSQPVIIRGGDGDAIKLTKLIDVSESSDQGSDDDDDDGDDSSDYDDDDDSDTSNTDTCGMDNLYKRGGPIKIYDDYHINSELEAVNHYDDDDDDDLDGPHHPSIQLCSSADIKIIELTTATNGNVRTRHGAGATYSEDSDDGDDGDDGDDDDVNYQPSQPRETHPDNIPHLQQDDEDEDDISDQGDPLYNVNVNVTVIKMDNNNNHNNNNNNNNSDVARSMVIDLDELCDLGENEPIIMQQVADPKISPQSPKYAQMSLKQLRQSVKRISAHAHVDTSKLKREQLLALVHSTN